MGMLSGLKRFVYYMRVGYSFNEILVNKLFSMFGGIPEKTLKNYLTVNLYYVFHRKNFKNASKNESEGIFVIETGVLGDSMIALHSFQTLYKFTQKTGQTLTILCNSSTGMIFKEYGGIEKAVFLTYGDRDRVKAKELKFIIKALKQKKFRYLLRRDSHALGTYIAGIANASEKIYYSYFLDFQSEHLKKYDQKIFHYIKNYEAGEFIPKIWKDMLTHIGVDDYLTEQGMLNRKNIMPALKKYILLSPESSFRGRSIEISLCEIIVKYLKTTSSDEIRITARGDDQEYMKQLWELAEKYQVEMLDRLSMKSFVKIVANAVGVIGCDSGPVHLAAAWNVPCVHIVGNYESGIFFPYRYEFVSEHTHEPVCVGCEELDCKDCVMKGQLAKLNPECEKMVANGKSLYCVANVGAELVLERVEKLLHEEIVR